VPDDSGQTTIKAAAKTVLEGVADLKGTVALQPGEIASWVKLPQPDRTFWEVSIGGLRERQATAGSGNAGRYRVTYRLKVEGWMPWGGDKRKTQGRWETITDAVRAAFRANRSLRGTIINLSLPSVPELDYEAFSGHGQKPEVILCHHVRFDFEAVGQAHYDTN
jgi:hypothetical protein